MQQMALIPIIYIFLNLVLKLIPSNHNDEALQQWGNDAQFEVQKF